MSEMIPGQTEPVRKEGYPHMRPQGAAALTSMALPVEKCSTV